MLTQQMTNRYMHQITLSLVVQDIYKLWGSSYFRRCWPISNTTPRISYVKVFLFSSWTILYFKVSQWKMEKKINLTSIFANENYYKHEQELWWIWSFSFWSLYSVLCIDMTRYLSIHYDSCHSIVSNISEFNGILT